VERGRRIRSVSALVVMACVACWCLPEASAALPEGRHYEMVSPLFKGGYNARAIYGVAMAGSDEGDRVAFASVGSFAGAGNNPFLTPYIARRSATGWSTESLMPPAAMLPNSFFWDLTPTLEWALFGGELGKNNGISQLESSEGEFVLDNLTGPGVGFSVAGMPLRTLHGEHLAVLGVQGTSPSFCHIVFGVGLGTVAGSEEALLPEAFDTNSFLYDLATGAPGCGEEAKLRLLSVGNELGPNHEPKVLNPAPPNERECISFLGATDVSEGVAVNAISADGRTIFFETALLPTECEEFSTRTSNPLILFARLDGEKTIEVSKPVSADCEDTAPCHSAAQKRAEFAGANQAGTRVFFTTVQPLVTDDTDTALDLYMAEIGCPAAKPACVIAEYEVTSLRRISQVQHGIAFTSADGSHVYFVAHGALGQEGPKGGGAQPTPIDGADNLYVYDANSGEIKFIADLCSGPHESGSVDDSRCPVSLDRLQRNDRLLWGENGSAPDLQVTNDGRFLLFAAYGRLVAGDTDEARDIYRYDEQTGALDRVSVGEEGAAANGNGDVSAGITPGGSEDFSIEEYDLARRAVSEDGSRVVFETAEPLSPKAVNGLVNAYEWQKEPQWSKGRVSLVSSGNDPEPVGVGEEGHSLGVVITPSGNDIFFLTAQGLLTQDTDGQRDVYDARLGVGFPPGEALRRACSGDACQGPLTNPAPLLVPGSVAQSGGENIVKTTRKAKAKKKKPKHRQGHKRTRGKHNRKSVSRRQRNVGGRR
jgi:hypothetical protein